MPQRIFKRKSNGKSNRNLESSSEESRSDEKGLMRNPEANTSTLKSENGIQGGSTIPNRVFVGGIPACVTEWDLRSKFAIYGNVKAVKIIRDYMGISRGYGFVTFNTEDEAKRALEKAEMTVKGRKLNIAPAVKKQNHRSEAQLSSETNSENYSESLIADQNTSRKGNMVYPQVLDYPISTEHEVATYVFDNPNPYFEGGMCFRANELQCGYSNAQVNILPYPTLVYLPQQAFQCAGTEMDNKHQGKQIENNAEENKNSCYF